MIPGFPFQSPRPWWRPMPVGWVTPALPYTGRLPRRMYLRCSMWPGPTGMVPAYAAQGPGGPALPGMPGMPGVPGMPGMPPGLPGPMGPGRGGRKRRGGRRRR